MGDDPMDEGPVGAGPVGAGPVGAGPAGGPESAGPGGGRGRVLVVDDDVNVRDVLRRYLQRSGFAVVEAGDGPTALELVRGDDIDLVILDLMLPGMDGLDVCRTLRRESEIGVIMLTALGSEDDRIVGLEHGADDYVTKPFSPREVTLRTERLIERTRLGAVRGSGPALADGDLVVNPVARTATRGGVRLALTGREFDLLTFLLRHPDQTFSRSELMHEVWQWTFGDESTVTVHVRRLREKIEEDPAEPTRLVTVWGHGYRYRPLVAGPIERGAVR